MAGATLSAKASAPAEWFASAIVCGAVWPQWGKAAVARLAMVVVTKPSRAQGRSPASGLRSDGAARLPDQKRRPASPPPLAPKCLPSAYRERSAFLNSIRICSNSLFFLGERGGTRTHDPLIKSQMLYRLSYALGSRAPVYSLDPRGSIESAPGLEVRAAFSLAKSSPAWCEERVNGVAETNKKPLDAPIVA
jgi:hypothetical protein